MPKLDHASSALLIIDFQSRLMPAIDGAAVDADDARLRRIVELVR